MTLLDDEGYPTEEWLQYIRDFNGDILDFLGLLMDGWSGGFKLHRKYRGKRKLELRTGGWSGNEEIVSAILYNVNLTHVYMRYTMWRAGGYYCFELSC